MTRRIIRHMSVFERLIQSDDSNRYFVNKVIRILREVEKSYADKRTFIVVGHSLGLLIDVKRAGRWKFDRFQVVVFRSWAALLFHRLTPW
jgi:hypothetical protein